MQLATINDHVVIPFGPNLVAAVGKYTHTGTRNVIRTILLYNIYIYYFLKKKYIYILIMLISFFETCVDHCPNRL